MQKWLRSPRLPLLLFFVIVAVSTATLGWVTWRLLEQDRALEKQRVQERLEGATDVIATTLNTRILDTEDRLRSFLVLPESQIGTHGNPWGSGLNSGALLTAFQDDQVTLYPPTSLPYFPQSSQAVSAPEETFASAEEAEFRKENLTQAMEAFRGLANSRNPLVRAGALMRLGRVLRKAGRSSEALQVYDQLSQLDAVPVGGLPAGLVGRHAQCEVLNELKRSADLRQEAQELYEDLIHGRWRISRATYAFYMGETRVWFTPDAQLEAHERENLSLAAGVEALGEEWQRVRQGAANRQGRRILWLGDGPVTLLWQSNADRLVGLVAPAPFVESAWLAPAEALAKRQNVRLALMDAEGHTVAGGTPNPSVTLVARTPAETQLPWTLHTSSADPVADHAQFVLRERLLAGGFVLIVLLVVAGSYAILRAVTRELAVTQLQSDFVAAVSHEFRTPLASLRQLSELLAEGRVPDEERRRRYYEGLRRETERLHRLVENLLDFGRMEAGAHPFRFERLDPAELVSSVAAEFAEPLRDAGYRLEVAVRNSLPPVRGDREALGRALWNLFDNAVKYSPECNTVWVEATEDADRAAIRVRDHELGIPASEQERIFQKFVRASSAREAGIKGTGLGLAMVRHIVAAHGGEIRLESEPGKGSTFTILLPAAS